MRLLSGRMCDDEVTLTFRTWGQDADASRVVASTRVVDQVPAVVLPGPGKTTREIAPETGLTRVTRTTPYTFEFDIDVGLAIEDLITWVDESGVTHQVLVDAYSQPAGRSGCWVASGEERF